MRERTINRYMRRQAVAFELGISRHTLARMIKADPTFPPFIEITPGIQVIERFEFERWLQQKRVKARSASIFDKMHPPATG